MSSLLGLRDEGELVIVDSNLKMIEEDPEWSYEATCGKLRIRPRQGDRKAILHGVSFLTSFPMPLPTFLVTLWFQKGGIIRLGLSTFT